MPTKLRFECPKCTNEVQISAGEVYDCSVCSWVGRYPTARELVAPTPEDGR
jgi:rubredoxin